MLLTTGKHEPWAKEPENLWVFRVLGIEPEEGWNIELHGNVVFLTALGKEKIIPIPIYRAYALSAWMNQAEDNPENGVSLVIEGPQGFLMHRKDDKHPNPKCRERLCLFSGSLKFNEKPLDGILRELYEEIRDVKAADKIAALMKYHGSLLLSSMQWNGTYTCHWFHTKTAQTVRFETWKQSMLGNPGLGESNPAFVTRSELSELITEERCNPGKHFVSSHHEMLARALNPTS